MYGRLRVPVRLSRPRVVYTRFNLVVIAEHGLGRTIRRQNDLSRDIVSQPVYQRLFDLVKTDGDRLRPFRVLRVTL